MITGRMIRWAWFVLLAYMFFPSDALGRLEGRAFPVTHSTVISQAYEAGLGTVIHGTSVKVRAECDWRKVTWFLGTPERHVEAQFKIIEMGKLRGEGSFEFGPWTVALTPMEVLDQSYAEVRHECHPLFDTITRFYPERAPLIDIGG